MNGVRSLLDGDVTVLHAKLDAHRGLAHVLSPDELMRSSRFRHTLHRDRYVAGRGLLRQLLAERLDDDPARIRIVSGEHGKPQLAEQGAIRFNLAHSDGDALFAFTEAGDVGIDIERVRTVDCLPLSRSCFSKRERDELLSLDASARLEAFFEGWVRKEAVIKADGRGMSLELHSFGVTLRDPPGMIEAPPGNDAAQWRLASLEAGPGLRAALAVRV